MSASVNIPIQNIYYLLCYAWNKLEEKDIVDVSDIESTNVFDLFAKVLIGGLTHLIKQGLDRGYVTFSEDTRCLRGKICFSQTVKKNLLSKAQVHCDYDELSHNILHNKILKTTIRLLTTIEDLDGDLRNELLGIYRKLGQIDEIELNRKVFSFIQLNRNNSFYDFLLKICELIYDNLLVSEEPGKSKFRDFLQEERKMAYLFEDFVRNFYKVEARECKVGREDISWQILTDDEDVLSYLPKMKTDISIERNQNKAIIDTKYYRHSLAKHRDTEKFHSTHMYQLHSYLTNVESKGGINKNCSGVLLYPTVETEINKTIPMPNHTILIRTIDLNQKWKNIHDDLISILNDSLS